MKRLLLIPLAIIIIASLVLGGWDEPSEASAQTTTTGGEPQSGGTLVMIGTGSTSNLGNPTKMSMGQVASLRYFVEWLVVWDKEGNPVPELAESWDVDAKNKTLTWHLQKGVKFHDGTPFDAKACKWNFDLRLEYHALNEGELVDSIEVIDDYTVRMNLNEYTSTQLKSYGLCVMFSPTAIETNGLEWATLHPVTTGPFKVTEVQRDVVTKMVKFEDYWRGDPYPYLDAMELRTIPETTTAIAMMEAGEADMWNNVAGGQIKMALDLQKKGFKITWGSGVLYALFPWAEDGIFADKRVRQALWCAIDLQGISNLLGYGTYEPCTQIAVSSDMGYNEGYDPYPYDLDRARELLAEAAADGVFVPNKDGGFDTEILGTSDYSELALAIQSNLADVGINAKIDIADMARVIAEQSKDGWDGLMLTRMGYMQDMYLWWDYYGTSAGRKYPIGIVQTDRFLDLLSQAQREPDMDTRRNIMKQAVKEATEDAMYVPLFTSPITYVNQPWVHREERMINNMVYFPHEWWMEAH